MPTNRLPVIISIAGDEFRIGTAASAEEATKLVAADGFYAAAEPTVERCIYPGESGNCWFFADADTEPF